MKSQTYRFLLLVALLLFVTGAVHGAGVDAQPGFGAISGQVTGPDGVTPVEGIRVSSAQVMENGYSGGSVDFTDANGMYLLEGMEPGVYIVDFFDFGGPYIWEYYDNAKSKDAATRIDVVAGQTVTGIDASLALGSALRGILTDADTGEPLSAVAALLWQQVNGNWQKYGQSTTNAFGLYRFSGLTPGVYRMGIFYGRPVYYDNAASLDTATDIVLEQGDVLELDLAISKNGPMPPPAEIPEPSTLLLVGAGLAGLIALARRRFDHT